MREDYGNINLETEDNGFGDGTNAPGTPEMLREHDDFGGENISLAPPEVTKFFCKKNKNLRYFKPKTF